MKEKTIRLATVVPIYKKEITKCERLSLETLSDNCAEDITIHFICPESFTIDDIEEWRQCLGDREVVCTQLEDYWFENVDRYSELMLSEDLWCNVLDDYDYVCIFQTDCLAFGGYSQTLKRLASEGWDYVGSPIISNTSMWKTSPTCGNGGLSLRKVKKMIEIAQNKTILDDLRKDDRYNKYEDLCICEGYASKRFIDKPSWKEAMEFAFDMNPDTLYNIKKSLPSAGCHAFGKNIPFWKEHLPDIIDDDIYEEAYSKHKIFIDIYYKK